MTPPNHPAAPASSGTGTRRTLRHGLTLARVDVRRILRTAVDRKFQLLGYAFVVLFFGGGVGYGSFLFGRELGFDVTLPVEYTVLEAGRGAFGLLWLFLAGLVAVRTVGTRGSLDNAVGVLSTVPTRDAVVGVLVSEYALVLTYATPLVLACTIGYGAGSGNWLPVATGVLVVLAACASAVAVAYPLGLAVRHVVTRIEFVARNKGALIALAFVAYMALIFTDVLGNVVVSIFEPLQYAPVAWYADVLLFGTPGVTANGLQAVAALALVPPLAVAGVAASTRIADRHWFADPVLAGNDDTEAGVDPDTDRHDDGVLRRFEDALGSVVGRGPAAVTVLAWKRAARAPLKLLYVAYPLLAVVGFLVDIVQTGVVPAIAPGAALVFVVWAGAAVFTLNPLGDQGSALPATVLSRLSGRAFVGAHLLAGVLVAVPAGTVVVGALAVLAPLDTDSAVAVVLATPASVVLGGLTAVGIGMAFPRYEAVNVTRSTKAVVPSLLAFAAFSASLLAAVATVAIVYEPAFEPFIAGFATWLLPFDVGVTPDTIGTAARVALLAFALAPLASVTYAIRRFETVTVD